MYFIGFRATAAAAALVAFALGASSASAVTYNATSNVKEGAGNHSLWFANDGSSPARPDGAIGSRPNHFKFENRSPGQGVFEVNGSKASLTGEVANADGQAFLIEMFFVEYTGSAYTDKKITGSQDTSDWTRYDLDTSKSSMVSYIAGTGTGNALQSFDVTLRGGPTAAPYKVQVGTGANEKDASLFGLSTWITLTDKTGASGCGFAKCSYAGDINIVLDMDPNSLPSVPVPAAGFLLLGGLGLLAGLRGRRRPA